MANRYITMAKDIITTYEKDYVIDYQMFVNKDYKNKFDDIKNKDASKLNTTKAENAFTCATYYQFAKHQYQTAFTFYEKAFKSEPSNDKYKRNYAYYLLKGIASTDKFRDVANYYKQLGNADDLNNLKIANHYVEHPSIPFYISRNAALILDRIANEKATMKDYNSLGSLIFYGNKVHQQYNLAYTFLHIGAEKYDDPLSYYTLAQMAENGFGGSFSNEEIIELYRRSALFNPEDKLFTPSNCKGCYKFGQMLAHGERTYTDLHQALKDAAEKGCGKAYYYIAKMMIEEHQYEAVLPIIEKGASKNHPKSVFIFGYLNMIEENKEVAEEFLSKGVNIAGNSTIAVKYGLLRLKGQVIEKK